MNAGKYFPPIAALLLMAFAGSAAAEVRYKQIHIFKGSPDGGRPTTGLAIDDDGVLYGTTARGGLADCPQGCGTAFTMTPDGTRFDYKVIHRFPNTGIADHTHAFPNELTKGGDGALYGSTYQGGDGYGTLFRLNPPASGETDWSYEELYRFKSTDNDGRYPTNAMVAVGGDLYGVTQTGGEFGAGTVFKLSRRGVKTTLYSFAGGTADANVPSALISNPAGGFFGVSSYGGAASCGTVFQLTRKAGAWGSKLLHSFQGDPGYGPCPSAGLLLRNGVLYGTKYRGGKSDDGIVYRLAPAGNTWSYSIIFQFQAQRSGIAPVGALVADSKGALYGMTNFLGAPFSFGTIYKLAKGQAGGDWIYTKLHVFSGDGSQTFDVQQPASDTRGKYYYDGGEPQAGLVMDKAGVLYGTTILGGVPCPGYSSDYTCGTVISLDP